jgi:hypothetical protein
MMRAFLVLGPESSGTRLLTRVLMAGGCAGDDGMVQRFDSWQFGKQDPIVWRRSVPYTASHLWPNIELDLLKPLRRHGYDDIMALVTTRDWFSLWRSQVDPKNGHAPNEAAALENIQLAYLEIFKQLGNLKLPFLVVAYEALVFFKKQAVLPLLKKLGLRGQPNLVVIRNQLGKYYP